MLGSGQTDPLPYAISSIIQRRRIAAPLWLSKYLMASTTPPSAGSSSPVNEQARRMAQQSFARGTEVFKTGDYVYAIKLFKDACKFAPDQLVYRQHLRISAKKKFDNNKRGSRLAAVTTVKARASLKAAK